MPSGRFVCSRVYDPPLQATDFPMDISRDEQRVLHALAQGGRIALLKNEAGKVTGLEFFNREGWLMSNCSLVLFKKLKAKKAIKSSGGQPYRITRRGLELVRSEYDNR
jgi:uncharacterized protein YjhX (UPF0386 family)